MSTVVRSGLSPKHLRAVELLAAGASASETAAALGVSDRTVRRWAQKPEFRKALEAAQAELWGHLVRRLRALGDRALSTLAEILGDRNAPPSPRVSAAKTVLELSLKLNEIEELKRRVEELEALVRSRRRV